MEKFFPHFAIPRPEGLKVTFGLANEALIGWFLATFLTGGFSRWRPWRIRRAVKLLCRAVGMPAPRVVEHAHGGGTIGGFDSATWTVHLFERFWTRNPEKQMATLLHELRHAEQQWLAVRWALANLAQPGVEEATMREVASWVVEQATPLPDTDPRYPFAALWWRSMIGPESGKIVGVNRALQRIASHVQSGMYHTAMGYAMWGGADGDTRVVEAFLRELPAVYARACLQAIRVERAYRTMPHESDAFHLTEKVERLAQRRLFS